MIKVSNVSSKTLKDAIRFIVTKELIIVTDEHLGYVDLDKEFAFHQVVNHGKDKYVIDND